MLKQFMFSSILGGFCLVAVGLIASTDLRADAPAVEVAKITSKTTLEKAEGTTLATAVGHFARARSLIIAAIHEFDQGTKIASPNAILNSAEWRKSLINRAEELEHILDPQPRITRSGVRYSADSRLISETKK